jgi:hypothetical protein
MLRDLAQCSTGRRVALASAVLAATLAGLAANVAAAASDARLAVGETGSGVVAATEFRAQVTVRGRRTDVDRVVVRARDADGTLGRQHAVTTGDVQVGSLVAAANPRGVGIVAWAQVDVRRRLSRLYAVRCTEGGCGSPILVDAHQTKLYDAQIKAIVRPDGEATLLWVSGMRGSPVSQLTADVPMRGAARPIVRLGDAGGQDALVVDGSGGVVAAWTARPYHHVTGLTLTSRGPRATRFSAPRSVTTLDVKSVALAARTGGAFVVATVPRGRVRGVLSFEVGSTPVMLAPGFAHPAVPAACLLDDGTELAAWAVPDARIVVQRPGRAAASISTRIATGFGLRLVASPGAGATLVWTQSGAQHPSVRTATIDPSGQPQPAVTIASNARMTDVAPTMTGTVIAGISSHGVFVTAAP